MKFSILFWIINHTLLLQLLSFFEIPDGFFHLVELAPGVFLFVAINVAGYCGLLVSLSYIFFLIF